MWSEKRRTFAQMNPSVSGLTLLPATLATRPSSTFTSRLHASGQSSGHIERRVSVSIAKSHQHTAAR